MPCKRYISESNSLVSHSGHLPALRKLEERDHSVWETSYNSLVGGLSTWTTVLTQWKATQSRLWTETQAKMFVVADNVAMWVACSKVPPFSSIWVSSVRSTPNNLGDTGRPPKKDRIMDRNWRESYLNLVWDSRGFPLVFPGRRRVRQHDRPWEKVVAWLLDCLSLTCTHWCLVCSCKLRICSWDARGLEGLRCRAI